MCWPNPLRQSEARRCPGQCPGAGLAAAARQHPKVVPLDEPGGIRGLRAVPHDPDRRRVLEKPPDRDIRRNFVVLVNIARLVAGATNLAVIPFRDGINPGKMKSRYVA